MKVQSSIYPENIWVRKIELGDAYIKLRNNIVEKEVENEGVIDTIYEFDEVEVKIANRPNLIQYIENNFSSLFEKGIQEEAQFKHPTTEERLEALELAILEMILGGAK